MISTSPQQKEGESKFQPMESQYAEKIVVLITPRIFLCSCLKWLHNLEISASSSAKFQQKVGQSCGHCDCMCTWNYVFWNICKLLGSLSPKFGRHGSKAEGRSVLVGNRHPNTALLPGTTRPDNKTLGDAIRQIAAHIFHLTLWYHPRPQLTSPILHCHLFLPPPKPRNLSYSWTLWTYSLLAP